MTASTMTKQIFHCLGLVLLIFASSAIAQTNTSLTCVSSPVYLTCTVPGETLTIFRATYGMHGGDYSCKPQYFNDCQEDVTDTVSALCGGNPLCTITSVATVFANICTEDVLHNTLQIAYSCTGANSNVPVLSSTAVSSTPNLATSTQPQYSTTVLPTTGMCGDSSVNIECPAQNWIIIRDVQYSWKTSCSSQKDSVSPSSRPCKNGQVLNHVTAPCSGFQACNYTVTKTQMIQFCNRSVNYATITHECVPEYQVIDICSANFEANSFGYVKTPSYPNRYPKSKSCDISIWQQFSGVYVLLIVLDLDMSPRTKSTGCFDFVLVEDVNDPFITQYYCGTMVSLADLHTRIITAYNMSVTYHSDAFIDTRKGFLFYYEMVELSDQRPLSTFRPLPTLLTTTTQKTTTTTTSTTSTTTTMPTTTVTVNVSSLNLPFKNASTITNCAHQNLTCQAHKELLVLSSVFGGPSPLRCPGAKSPTTCLPQDKTYGVTQLCSTTNACSLSGVAAGLQYSCTDSTEVPALTTTFICVNEDVLIDICDPTLTVLPSKGFLHSPKFPQPYSNNLQCSKHLVPASSSATMYVKVVYLSVQNRIRSVGCYDYLRLIEQNSIMNSFDLCGNNSNIPNQDMFFDEVNITFTSDGQSSSNNGFILYYEVVPGKDGNSALRSNTTALPTTASTPSFHQTVTASPVTKVVKNDSIVTSITPTTSTTTAAAKSATTNAQVTTYTNTPTVVHKSKDKGGMIAGIIIGIIVFLIIVATLAYVYYRHRKGRPLFTKKLDLKDLFASTRKEEHTKTMNAQTYLSLPRSNVLYDIRAQGLTAHESALSDSNLNLSVGQEHKDSIKGAPNYYYENPGFAGESPSNQIARHDSAVIVVNDDGSMVMGDDGGIRSSATQEDISLVHSKKLLEGVNRSNQHSPGTYNTQTNI